MYVLSTTVVLLGLHAACSDNVARSPGASGAMRTSPPSGQWSAWLPARDARRGGASRQHSMGPRAPRRFARGQPVGRRLAQHVFWSWEGLQGRCPHDCQQRLCPPRHGDRPIPPWPTAPCAASTRLSIIQRCRPRARPRPGGRSAGPRRPRPSVPGERSRGAGPTARGATPEAWGRPKTARTSPPPGALWRPRPHGAVSRRRWARPQGPS